MRVVFDKRIALGQEFAAAIVDVGAAKADLYPSPSLSGSVTIDRSTLTGMSLPWSFGPVPTIPLFDGGSRQAVRSAIAEIETALCGPAAPAGGSAMRAAPPVSLPPAPAKAQGNPP